MKRPREGSQNEVHVATSGGLCVKIPASRFLRQGPTCTVPTRSPRRGPRDEVP
eukprot:CAMPEP_0184263008 /NCGR_PEP_ID=MMETSP0977-20130417/17075_1 /TAXON_ID=483370 /ORGANISM="non described non described, Strain CCMP2097" /LENGTH=52 /DNA_ID=CAMNT_0026568701 /DNA_START=136 /DNA_END=291 /DNA_ORIENTATION=-